MARKSLHPKWVTEYEVCDYFEKHDMVKDMPSLPESAKVVVHREANLVGNYRPDFLLFADTCFGQFLYIIEVKITAEAKSVAQLANYIAAAEHHTHNAHWFGKSRLVKVVGILVARYFDASAEPFFKTYSCESFEALRWEPQANGSIEIVDSISPYFSDALPASSVLKNGIAEIGSINQALRPSSLRRNN